MMKLIGFDQFLVPSTGTKYKGPNDPQREPLGNTKRVFITDRLVDQLVGLNIKDLKFEAVCKNPHPQSVDVINQEARFEEMQDYRKTNRFRTLKSWLTRAWLWFISWFRTEKNRVFAPFRPEV